MVLRFSLAAAMLMATAVPAMGHADDLTQSAAASRDSVVASAKLTAAGVKLVAGVAFAPVRRTLRDSDRAAQAAGESGRFVNDSANGHLEVSPETVQAQPAPNVPYDAHTGDNGAQDDKTGGQ
jgi:hypothetical protein